MTTVQPLVSIVIPVYNVENYITDCLESLSAQNYGSCEIILVDDCSQDSSMALCAAKASTDSRFRIISHSSNRGVSAARNTGLACATGRYVVFVDADDLVHPEMISRCVAVSDQLGADVLTFDWVTFHDHPSWGKQGGREPNAQMGNRTTLLRRQNFAWAKFFRRTFLVENEIEFIEGRSYEDHSHHWEVCLSAGIIGHIQEDLYGYRLRPGSITKGTDTQLLDRLFMYGLVPKIFGDAQLTREEADILNAGSRLAAVSVLLTIDRKLLSRALYQIARLPNLRVEPTAGHSASIADSVLGRVAQLTYHAGTLGVGAVSAIRFGWQALRWLRVQRRRVARWRSSFARIEESA